MKQLVLLAGWMLVCVLGAAPVPPCLKESLLWLDAADAATLETDASGAVASWTSKGAVALVARAARAKPVLLQADGLTLVDFGGLGSGRDLVYPRLTTIRTLFVAGRFASDLTCHLLGDANGGKGQYHFHRGDAGAYASPGWSNIAAVWNGTQPIEDPADTPLPADRLQVVVAEMKGPSCSDALTNDRDMAGRTGGRRLGEVIAFDRVLSEADRTAIARYLLEKWHAQETCPVVPSETRLAWNLLARDIANWSQLPSAVNAQAVNRQACILPGDVDPLDVLLRRTAALAADLSAAADVSQEAVALVSLTASARLAEGEEARFALFEQVQALNRRLALKNPLLKGIDRLLFVGHQPPGFREWADGSHMCDQYYGFHGTQGGTTRGDGLYVLEDPFGEQPVARDLLKGRVIAEGAWKGQTLDGCAFLSPDLDWDGSRIAFAATRGKGPVDVWNDDTAYHVFTCRADGSDLRQLTTGPWNEFDPCWLPNGRLVFNSERRGGYVRCSGDRPVTTFTLHSMFPDGTDITCLSYHETNEWHPSVNNDGMLVYTRWDYVDRGAGQAHHAWTSYPDGRDPRALNGNTRLRFDATPKVEMNVRQIPGSRKYVATAASHHGVAVGSLILIDPAVPDDGAMSAVRRVTPEQLLPESEQWSWQNRMSGAYATAWPLSEKYFLCAYEGRANGRYEVSPRRRYGLALVDVFGNRTILYRHPTISCLDPIPLRARPRPPVVRHQTLVGRPATADGVRPETIPAAELPKTAEVGLINVYDTRLPFPTGTVITALRVWQLFPKTEPLQQKPWLGAEDRQLGRQCLGTVPVEKDGSAYFKVPVNIPFFLQALDARGIPVQNMRSDTYVHPGERLLCSGCHEPTENVRRTARTALPLALRRPPSEIAPGPDGSAPFNFTRLVQPVLDNNCVGCHGEKRDPKAPDLRAGDWRKNKWGFSTSFKNLVEYTAYFAWNLNHKKGGGSYEFFEPAYTQPSTYLAAAAPLRKLLEDGHHGVELTSEEWSRLILWMDSNGQYISHDNDPEAQRDGKIVPPACE